MAKGLQKSKIKKLEVQSAFGARVRYLRLSAELSQEELADLCSLDRTYVGGIERGERNPTLKIIVQIARALRVPAADLFLEWGRPSQKQGDAR